MFTRIDDDIQIIQIMPSGGWRALYAHHRVRDRWFFSELVCWALIRYAERDKFDIVAIDAYDEMGGEIGIAPHSDYFIGYLSPNEDISEEEAKLRCEIIHDIRDEDNKQQE